MMGDTGGVWSRREIYEFAEKGFRKRKKILVETWKKTENQRYWSSVYIWIFKKDMHMKKEKTKKEKRY